MALRPEEITSVLERELSAYETGLKMDAVGTILKIGDGIATIHGLDEAMAGELLEFPGGQMGIVLNLEINTVGAALLTLDPSIREGDLVKRTGRIASVPVGEPLLGRVVNPIGEPLDGKGPVVTKEFRPIDSN
ncbi:MAG TPA: F0F1 ATP synthase subunit alpha, partial [bacterium]|nr:F0F1 ATP synthase subunit alpha [bacterium]